MPLISLTIIVGNVADYIERCLSSFAPIADEIVIVRAIGNQQPDDTLAIAQRVCESLAVPMVVAEYRNAPGHEDWPHVDSFAAARQQSFDLATGDYCFWADTDDVLAPGSAELIRQHAARGGVPVFIFPYEIFGRGVTVPRERMILREARGRWLYPVHECYQFDMPVTGASDERVVVQHLPKPSKTGSTERNLRILESIPPAELTAGLLYHLHCEQLGAGRKADAVESAKLALASPEIGRPEKYELFLNLARLAENPAVAHQLVHQAFVTDPTRREALGMLACTAIDHGRPLDALAHARQMLATERPADWNWNDRGAAYGWLGAEIFQQALRANGRGDEAERVRLELLRSATVPVISLLHATRGRPRQASIARKLWLDLAEFPESIEHIFAFDDDDEKSNALARFHHVCLPPGGGCVRAWNAAAAFSNGAILVQLSDDWLPPAKWDTLIRERMGDLARQSVLAVSDGHRTDALLCIAILTRTRWLAQTVFTPAFTGPALFHPDFTGVFSDNWFSHCAWRDGVVIEARDLIFEHQHPLFDPAVKCDETYAAQNAPARYDEGKAIFDRLLAEDVPLFDWHDIPGWCDFTDFYAEISRLIPQGGTAIEVGVWMGQSLCYLAQCLRARGWEGTLVAVDTFVGEQNQPAHAAIVAEHGGSIRAAFDDYMLRAGIAPMLKVIQGVSWEVPAQHCGLADFVFLDAAHDAESVAKDLAAWWPVIAPGGILAGHDYPHVGVRTTVDSFFAARGLAVGVRGRCWIVKKPATNE